MRGAEDVELVLAARSGDDRAFGILFDRWFDRVYDVAWRIVRNRDIAAEVAQESMLAAWESLASLEQPASFGGWLLRTARNKALNRLDRERRSVAIGDEETTMEIDRRSSGVDTTGLAVEEAEHAALLWAAADALGERDASVLDLHLRHGMGAPELADALGVTANNAHQLLFRMKGKLAAAVKGWVLWSGGQPTCADLGALLGSASITSFGPEAVRAIHKHAGRCEECTARQESRLSPEAMFAAVPIVAAPTLLKAKAAAAMEAAGVSMGGSVYGPVPVVPARPRRFVRVALAAAAVVVLITIAAIALLASKLDDGTGTTAAPEATTSTAPATSTTTVPIAAAEPAVAVVVPEPESTTTTSTSTTTTVVPRPDPAAPPPTISGFRATPGFGPECGSTVRKITLVWASTDATTAVMSGQDAPAPIAPNGSDYACDSDATGPDTYTLTVTGPGGSATQSVTV